MKPQDANNEHTIIHGRVAEWSKTDVFYSQGLWFKTSAQHLWKVLKTMFHGSTQAMRGKMGSQQRQLTKHKIERQSDINSLKLTSDCYFDVNTLPYLTCCFVKDHPQSTYAQLLIIEDFFGPFHCLYFISNLVSRLFLSRAEGTCRGQCGFKELQWSPR